MYSKHFMAACIRRTEKIFARDIPFRPGFPKAICFSPESHIVKAAKPLVQNGDSVLADTFIAEADGFVSANIISSVLFRNVKAIEKWENKNNRCLVRQIFPSWL